MSFDSKKQREIMGRFATGVTVVGTRVGEELWGMTANAVTSLSLDPPLVLVAVDRRAQTHGQLTAGGCFAISILTREQESLSNRFAGKGPKDFSGLKLRPSTSGAPVLEDCLAYVDCRLVEILPGGDHDIFIGEILAGEVCGESQPLLYYGGGYRGLSAD